MENTLSVNHMLVFAIAHSGRTILQRNHINNLLHPLIPSGSNNLLKEQRKEGHKRKLRLHIPILPHKQEPLE